MPLRLSRTFHAPRETVFKAWSSADHVKRWFCPETFTVPDAKVEMRVGGPFEVCMRSPAGEEHWTRGVFVEVAPYARLVIDTQVTDSAGKQLFRAYTEVDFADALGGARMDVVQTYTLIDPSVAWMVAGAPHGWRTTLDKLEKEVVRMRAGWRADGHSVVHASFHLERTYEARWRGCGRHSPTREPNRNGLAAPPAAGNCSNGTWTCASGEASGSRGDGRAGWFQPSTRSITT